MLSAKDKARITKLLQYAAPSGNAVLVNLKTCAVVATGGENRSTALANHLVTAGLQREMLEELTGISTGQVGDSHLLVVKEDIRIECTVLRARMDKACDMLSRVLERSSARSAARFRPWMKED